MHSVMARTLASFILGFHCQPGSISASRLTCTMIFSSRLPGRYGSRYVDWRILKKVRCVAVSLTGSAHDSDSPVSCARSLLISRVRMMTGAADAAARWMLLRLGLVVADCDLPDRDGVTNQNQMGEESISSPLYPAAHHLLTRQ